MLLGAFRFLAAGLIMLVWSLLKGDRILDASAIKHSSVSGILMLFGGTGIVIWVEQFISSGLVAIIVSAAPIWFVLLDRPMWKLNFNNRSIIFGLLIGFTGVLLLFSEKISDVFLMGNYTKEFLSMMLIILGSVCWVTGSLYSKYRTSAGSNTVNVGWQMFAAGVVFTLVSLFFGEQRQLNLNHISAEAWFSIAYLIFFGSIAAYTAYVWLLQVRPSTQVSTYAYVNPVVAVLLGVFFANEKTTFVQILGLAVILASVLMINLARYREVKRTSRAA